MTAHSKTFPADRPLNIAVIGSGISGMSAAWLLSEKHDVTVYERQTRLGGHSNTVDAKFPDAITPVDTGFIVYNETTYPNLTALFKHLDVPTKLSDMTFAVSLDEGKTEYAAKDLTAFLARPSNFFSPRFWSMARDLWRFYRRAAVDIQPTDSEITLGDYLDAEGYSQAFQRDHLLPQAAAIWSSSPDSIRDYPACAFVRFFENHGLLQFVARPLWRTVDGGSRAYVKKLTSSYADRVRLGAGAVNVRRVKEGVGVRDATGKVELFDEVVIAAHADEALAMLDRPTDDERRLLGAFRYTKNRTVLHTDRALMPRRKALWSAWNYVGRSSGSNICSVSYWMNSLQSLETPEPLFVTLNPHREPRAETILREEDYDHPLFDAAAVRAQRQLWTLQGVGGIWYCGAHFGSGFHEDGLQAGLAVAEQLGGVRRPWEVENESGRIHLTPPATHRRNAPVLPLELVA